MELPGLRAVRLSRLLTQDELAVKVEMTKATISRLEAGLTRGRISTVRKLAKALEVEPGALMAAPPAAGSVETEEGR